MRIVVVFSEENGLLIWRKKFYKIKFKSKRILGIVVYVCYVRSWGSGIIGLKFVWFVIRFYLKELRVRDGVCVEEFLFRGYEDFSFIFSFIKSKSRERDEILFY